MLRAQGGHPNQRLMYGSRLHGDCAATKASAYSRVAQFLTGSSLCNGSMAAAHTEHAACPPKQVGCDLTCRALVGSAGCATCKLAVKVPLARESQAACSRISKDAN